MDKYKKDNDPALMTTCDKTMMLKNIENIKGKIRASYCDYFSRRITRKHLSFLCGCIYGYVESRRLFSGVHGLSQNRSWMNLFLIMNCVPLSLDDVEFLDKLIISHINTSKKIFKKNHLCYIGND